MKIRQRFTVVVFFTVFIMLCSVVAYAEATPQEKATAAASYIFTKADEPLPNGDFHQCSYFNDMKGHWSRDNVCFVRENNIMTGVYPDQFRPQETFSRSMAITVLYRLAGSPAVEIEAFTTDGAIDADASAVSIAGFTDIEQNYYYTKPVVWAVKNGIVSSSNTNRFNPYNPITREELAILFYNYASYMGYDVSAGQDRNILDNFGDKASISPWAARAIAYMANIGVMSGNADNDIQPRNAIVRGEVAAMIERFISYGQALTPTEAPNTTPGAALTEAPSTPPAVTSNVAP